MHDDSLHKAHYHLIRFSDMTSRRGFLALWAGVAASLAGCSQEEAGSLSMTRMDSDEGLGEQLTYGVDPDTSPTQARILREAIDGGTTAPGDLEPDAYRRDESGEATFGDEPLVADRPPWMPRRPIVREGRVYEVTWEAVAEESRTIYEVRATPAEEGAGDPEIEFVDLPALDREKLHHLPPRVETSEDFSVANRYTAAAAELEESVFVPDQQYEVIEVRGRAVAIETTPAEATVTTFRYEAETLADSVEAYGSQVRDTHDFVLDGLDEDEREVVEEAVGGNYVAEDDSDEAFEGVVERFNREEPVVDGDGRGGKWLAEYEGTSYWAELEVYENFDGSGG